MTVRRDGRLVQAVVLIAIAVFMVSVPGWAGDYWTRILTGVCMWAGLAMAWNVLGGYGGYISFGHAAFFGIGAYATAVLMQPERGWNFFLTLPVGAAAAAVVAAVVGWPTLKLRGAYFAIATWALAEAIAQLATVASFTGGSSGLTIPGFESTSYFFYAMLIAAAVTYLLCYVLLERSRFGFKIRAVRDNEAAARSVGIDTTRVKIQAFVLSAVIPAVFGGIDAYWITFMNPSSVLSADITDQMVVMALIGGLGTMWGPAIGAAALYILNRQFVAWFGDTTSYIAMVGALVALVVLFLPDGLVSLVPGARRLRLVRQWLPRPKSERA
jgi:branched-chain amino acid transport system permease protein